MRKFGRLHCIAAISSNEIVDIIWIFLTPHVSPCDSRLAGPAIPVRPARNSGYVPYRSRGRAIPGRNPDRDYDHAIPGEFFWTQFENPGDFFEHLGVVASTLCNATGSILKDGEFAFHADGVRRARAFMRLNCNIVHSRSTFHKQLEFEHECMFA